MKVFTHVRTEACMDWENTYQEFGRVPVVGEYFALHGAGPWYQVQLVVHTPFENNLDAEVYAVVVDSLEILKTTFKQ